ncbi:hypothetical protein V492_04727 [Pseudogymnoascus sp. VKM F-4246]|nr:hypothetical protein V492_04727 [Pseudogymnoascus sp. VKM F-4246]
MPCAAPSLKLTRISITASPTFISQSGSVYLDSPLVTAPQYAGRLGYQYTTTTTTTITTTLATCAQVSQECVTKFNELKLGKSIKYIIYKLSDDYKEIVVEDASEDADWEGFRQKLISAQSKTKSGSLTKGPRYAVYDFSYDLSSGEGKRSKITFIAWSPDDAGIQPKMVYASSKDALKRSLNGLAAEFQANDEDDIEYASVLQRVSKGLA